MALLVALSGTTIVLPFCDSSLETYAIYQCSDRAYVEPVPAPYTPGDVTATFWQIGFGNNTLNTGGGTDGTGVQSKSNFNGNDSGNLAVDILDASASFPGEGFPPGSVCLGSNNWAQTGVDGCCDNPRAGVQFAYDNVYHPWGPYYYPGDDNILNPYFGTYLDSVGYSGYFSRGSLMDYPTAVLLTTPGDSWFALAAVSNMDRDNNGDLRGPCNRYGGTNPAACDTREGFFSLADVSNGLPNALTSKSNVIPWQAAPRPVITCTTNCADPNLAEFAIQVGPVYFNHDLREKPSNNPTLPDDFTRAGGVGVVDLLRKWNGLVRYTIELAPLLRDLNGRIDYPALVFSADPNLTDLLHPQDSMGDPAGPATAPISPLSGICYRTRVSLGRAPVEPITGSTACRDGGCGDLGYVVASTADSAILCRCFEGETDSDADSDGYDDCNDNCRSIYNPNQQDSDGDWIGDPCDPCPLDPDNDLDGDTYCAGEDNCPSSYNADQADLDMDSVGDVCDNCPAVYNDTQLDTDADAIGDPCDNCPSSSNSGQEDIDSDLLGDACDNCPSIYNDGQEDIDADSIGDPCDNCPVNSNTSQVDSDGDTFGDACDNCPGQANPSQADYDGDALGNSCDNCLTVPNPGQEDIDGDLRGDVCDNCPTEYNTLQDNSDGDSWGDVCDNCLFVTNEDQVDMDSDFEGDACDLDDGEILVEMATEAVVVYQLEAGFSNFNIYRASMDELRQSGLYTQDPNAVPEAAQFCGEVAGSKFDPYMPGPGGVVFYLTSGYGPPEADLGTDGYGLLRPNDNPCP